MARIVDLSHVIAPSPQGTPDFLRTDVVYEDHDAGAALYEQLLQVPRRVLRDGEGPATEHLSLGTHSATHVDAPYHYNSTIQGRPAQTIDEVPLEHFFGPGVVVDALGREDGDAVTLEQMQAGIAAAGHALTPGDIVLVHTGCDRFYDQPDYMAHGPGVTAEATRWLVDQGVWTMGIDAWGWDQPLHLQAQEARDQGNAPGILWAAHQVDRPYSQLERLTNLAALPKTGFTVACFPLKIQGASAAPARVVAIL